MLLRLFPWIALLLVACGAERAETASPGELRRALAAAERIEVRLLASASGPAAEGLRERVALSAATLAEAWSVEVVVLEGDEPGDSRAARIVLGSPADALVQELLTDGGASLQEDGTLSWNGCVLLDAGDAFLACFEDPERRGLPLNLFLASDAAGLAALALDLTPCARAGLRFLHRDRPSLDLHLSSGGRSLVAGPGTLPAPAWQSAHRSEYFHARRGPAVNPQLARAYGRRVEDAIGSLEGWAGAGPRGFQEIFLVQSGERQRALAGRAGQWIAGSGSDCAFALVAAGVPDDGGAGAAACALRTHLGEPAAAWMLEAAGIDAAGSWWGSDLRDWGRRLAELGLLLPKADIVHAGAAAEHSQHILAPLRGLLWSFLRESRGAPVLRSLWRGEASLEIDEEAFHAWLGGHPGGLESLAPAARAAHLGRINESGFWRGVAYASNAQPGGGYDLRQLGQSLESARRQTANAACVTSFYAARAAPLAVPGAGLRHGRESLEGDLAIAQVSGAARARGLSLLALRPQLLLSESAGYATWLPRTRSIDWEDFYAEYRPMATHYALVAELCDFDILCLGSGLAAPEISTGQRESILSLRRANLSAVLEGVRAGFGGALTYAADWPGEARHFRHWDQVDFMGVSWFPSNYKRDAGARGQAALRRAWNAQLTQLGRIAAKAEKRLLVMEFGVRSTRGGTQDTRMGAGPADENTQEQALNALSLAIADLAQQGLEPLGLFWWHWDAAGADMDPERRSYSLQGLGSKRSLANIGRGL